MSFASSRPAAVGRLSRRCRWLSALGALCDIAIPLAPTSDVTSRLCLFYLGSYSLDFPVSRVVSMCSHPPVVDIDNHICRRLDSDGANGKKNRRCFPPRKLNFLSLVAEFLSLARQRYLSHHRGFVRPSDNPPTATRGRNRGEFDMCVTATRRRAQVRPSGGERELCTAASLLLHSPLVDDTPAWPLSLFSKDDFGILFPVACWTWDMPRNPNRQGPVSLSFGRTRSPSRSQRIQVVPPRVNPLVYPLMEPDRGMNASASPSMARVVKERTGNPPRDPVCVFCLCCIRKTPRRLWHRRS